MMNATPIGREVVPSHPTPTSAARLEDAQWRPDQLPATLEQIRDLLQRAIEVRDEYVAKIQELQRRAAFAALRGLPFLPGRDLPPGRMAEAVRDAQLLSDHEIARLNLLIAGLEQYAVAAEYDSLRSEAETARAAARDEEAEVAQGRAAEIAAGNYGLLISAGVLYVP